MKRLLTSFAFIAVFGSAGLWAATSEVADAAMRSQKDRVISLIQQKADLNAPQADGTTALHWAVRADDLALVDSLLKAGADVKAVNRAGVNALYLACENGNPAMIDRLLKAGADVNATVLMNGETPLMIASRVGNPKGVELLLAKGADVNAKENLRSTTAIMWAAEQNHPEVVKLLASRGADVNGQSKVNVWEKQYGLNARVKEGGNTGGLTPLILAAREGALDSVAALLEAGADVNKVAGDESSAMMVAVQNGHYKLATLLLEKGTNPNIQNNKGWNALYLAVKNRNLETGTIPVPNADQALPYIKALLEKKADPNLQLTANTEIRNGQRATWMNEAGATPFLRAAMCGDVEVMRLLLKYGADPTIKTNDNTTPLMAVGGVGYTDGFIHDRSEEESMEALKFLVEEVKVPINAQNDGGLTALHGAAHKAWIGGIQYLVDHGADLSIADKGSKAYGANTPGLLPIHWAEGVVIGVQSAIYHTEAVDLITKMMNERGIAIPKINRTLGGNAKAKAN